MKNKKLLQADTRVETYNPDSIRSISVLSLAFDADPKSSHPFP